MARKIVIVRDDDTNRFTDPVLLGKVYAHAFERGFRLSLSVIPRIDTSVRITGKNSFTARGFTHEPCVPKRMSDSGFYVVSENKRLISWIRKHKNVEVCMHGYSHRKADFLSANAPLVRHKVREGRSILEQCVGSVSTFVPPHEALSKTAWRVLSEERLCIFRNIIRPLKDMVVTVPLFEYRPSHLPRMVSGFNGIVRYRHNTELGGMRPYLFSAYWDQKVAFEHACRVFDRSGVFIMANHYWEFALNPRMVAWWDKFVDYMAAHDIRSLTAREAIGELP